MLVSSKRPGSNELNNGCVLFTSGFQVEVSATPSRGVFDKEIRTKPLMRKRLWSELKANGEKPPKAVPGGSGRTKRPAFS